MDRYDQIRLQQQHAKFRKQNNANIQRSLLKDMAAEFNEAANVEVVEQILSRLSPNYAQSITEGVPREKCQDPTQWGREIGKILSKLEVDDLLDGPDLFVAIINPYFLELEISRSDRLDEAIDRKIKQLLHVKTAKQVFPNMRKNARPEPKLINPPASADRQPVVVSEGAPEPATQAEIAVSAKSAEKEAFTAHDGVVIEGGQTDRDGPAPVPDGTEKEHLDLEHVTVEFFAKPVPRTLDELIDDLEGFSARCDEVMISNARSNRASSPNATPT